MRHYLACILKDVISHIHFKCVSYKANSYKGSHSKGSSYKGSSYICSKDSRSKGNSYKGISYSHSKGVSCKDGSYKYTSYKERPTKKSSHYVKLNTFQISLIALLIIITTPAHAAKQTLTYDVYIGGFRAVEAVIDIDLHVDRYDINLTAYTRGWLGKLAPWKGMFESRGWVNANGSFSPEQHKATTTWRDEVEIKDYQYSREHGFQGVTITDHDKPSYKKNVSAELTSGTTDMLSAALSVFKDVARGKECAGSSEVFDGKRRFKQVFAHQGWIDLASSRYNIYQGPAAQCIVEVIPIAGKWREKPRGWMSIQEQGRKKGSMPTLWMAAIKDGQPAVPVKIRVKTQNGTMFMHLTKYHSDDTILIADKRAKSER